MRRIVIFTFLALVMMSCSPKKQTHQSEAKEFSGIPVKVVKTALQDVGQTMLSYSGISEPSLTVPLSFQLPGKVVSIKVDEGSMVKKGQVLATLDKTSYQSSYNAALASQKQAQDAYERLKTVYDKGSLPEIKWQEVNAKLEQANSAANIARKNLDNCEVTSPISGVISSRNVEVGENVALGISVFQVISAHNVDVKVSVPDNEISRIEQGQAATVTFPALGDRAYEASVSKIGVTANRISKTFEVKLRIENSDGSIKPGMVCEVELSLEGTGSTLLVPIQSVMKDERGQDYVFVVDESSNTAVRKNIQSSGILNNQLCITSGLQDGELLVVEGQHKLTDQTKVQINQEIRK